MLPAGDSISELIPNEEFSQLANDEQIKRTAQALEDKVLIINREIQPNRITMIIVKEELGF